MGPIVRGMSAIGLSLEVSGEGDRHAAHSEITRIIHEFIHRYTGIDPYPSASEYRGEWISVSEDVDDDFGWWFWNPGGCCSRSEAVWCHWFELALAAEWEAIERVITRVYGLRAAPPRSDLGALLAGKDRFLLLRGDLWTVWEEGLGGDDAHVAVADLTPEERAQHAAALERCQCPICPMLRLDPEAAREIFAQLDDPETAVSAAWYLSRTHPPSFGTLTALIRAGESKSHEMATTFEDYVRRLPDAWPQLMSLLPGLRGCRRGLALYALDAAVRDDADRKVLLRESLTALAAAEDDPEAAEAAIALLGRNRWPVPGLTEELCAILDRGAPEALRIQTIVALANLHGFEACALDPALRTRFEREIETGSVVGTVANFFLEAPKFTDS